MKKNPFREVVDIEELRSLFEDFTSLTGFATALLDMEGNVLVATGWRQVCTEFHRKATGSLQKCLESDTELANRISQGQKYSIYRCKNGLIDVAVPIVIDGSQIGRLYSGQFLFEPPDMEFFRRQAAENGFDEAPYLDAVRKVPIVSEERVRQVMAFMCRLAEIIVRMGMTNKKVDDANLIVKNSQAVLFRWKTYPGWPIEYVSDNIMQFGYTPQELVSKEAPYSSLMHPEDLDRIASQVNEYYRRDVERFELEYRIVTKAGDIRWVEERTVRQRNAEGSTTHYQGIVIDITERRRAEEELYFSQFCLEEAPLAIIIFSGEGKSILGVNDHACKSLGYSREELLTMSVFNLNPFITLQDIKDIDKAVNESGTLTFEGTNRRKDGTLFPVEVTIRNLDYQGKNFVFTFVIDISERKKAEEQIHTALAEKELLLKEVHHRVKNNMQIISTLLDLQSEGIGDEEALAAFRESQDRIKAMALIHERLYQSTDIAFVDFQRYIEELSAHLFDSYTADPGRITLHVDAGGVVMGIDRAIPCGLIINELVTNALKHAFPDNRRGVIRIDFQGQDDGEITLRVADNGVGLPPGLDLTRTGTLGLQLVTMLVRQIRGDVRIEKREGGTTIIIEFPGK